MRPFPFFFSYEVSQTTCMSHLEHVAIGTRPAASVQGLRVSSDDRVDNTDLDPQFCRQRRETPLALHSQTWHTAPQVSSPALLFPPIFPEGHMDTSTQHFKSEPSRIPL